MNQFSKVSYEEFCKGANIDPTWEESEKTYFNIVMPQRKTKDSAGYDITSPFSFSLEPGNSLTVATGIKIYLDNGLWLMGIPRSSLGFNYEVVLANTVMCVDGDYVDNQKNEGQIFAKIVNKGNKTLEIKKGDGFVQGIITNYYKTVDDNPGGKRIGGIGSTN